jgi:hypothetical protein
MHIKNRKIQTNRNTMPLASQKHRKLWRVLSICFVCIMAVIISGVGYVYYSPDGADDIIFRLLLGEVTIFSSDYSEREFRRISIGMHTDEVLSRLGQPLVHCYHYGRNPEETIGRFFITLCFDNNDRVSDVLPYIDRKKDQSVYSEKYSEETLEKVKVGMSKSDVESLLGNHLGETLVYSRRKIDSHYRVRTILIDDNRVYDIRARFYVD